MLQEGQLSRMTHTLHVESSRFKLGPNFYIHTKEKNGLSKALTCWRHLPTLEFEIRLWNSWVCAGVRPNILKQAAADVTATYIHSRVILTQIKQYRAIMRIVEVSRRTNVSQSHIQCPLVHLGTPNIKITGHIFQSWPKCLITFLG